MWGLRGNKGSLNACKLGQMKNIVQYSTWFGDFNLLFSSWTNGLWWVRGTKPLSEV
jgi:hypothetical protein